MVESVWSSAEATWQLEVNESALWAGRTVVYSALLTLFTHSGVTQRDLLVLKSTHLQSFESGKPSAEEKRSRNELTIAPLESCSFSAQRAAFLRREQWWSGVTRNLTGRSGSLVRSRLPQGGYRSSTAQLLPACRRSSPDQGVFSGFGVAFRGLPWKHSASYWLTISFTRADWCKASQSRLPAHQITSVPASCRSSLFSLSLRPIHWYLYSTW